MKFVELSEIEFMDFVNSRPEKNFFQTTYMKHKLELDKKEVHLLGLKDEEKIVAATLVCNTGHKFLNKYVYEAYKGFILDYHNKEILSIFTKEIKNFLKSKNALKLIIDPYIPNVSRDCDGNMVTGVDNREVDTILKDLGYKYNNNGYQVKWCYCLDIDGKSSDELFKEMKNNTRNNINRTIKKYHLKIRTLKKEELPEFKKITSDTCKRRRFLDKDLVYYERMYDTFKDQVIFKICELDCNDYIYNLKEENKIFEEKLKNLSDSCSNRNKKEVMRHDINSNLEKIKKTEELIKSDGEIIPLSCAMFILYGDEVIYLFSGSYEKYMEYCGQYSLQWDIIKYAADNGYKRYNFYGITNPLDKNETDHGVHEFKKGFGGYVEELLGSYTISISNLNNLYELLSRIKSLIKK